MRTRVLESGVCTITQDYSSNHPALDLVKEGSQLDYIVAHSDGKVIFYQDGYDNLKGSVGNIGFGNFVRIDHGNGFVTMYAHMRKNLLVKNGETVRKGQRLGYMGDSGNAYGAHLHFEITKNGVRINPTEYLDKDLYEKNNVLKYKVGDEVTINGVYVSSTSSQKLSPRITTGTITRIVNNVRNPYLLDNGNIGWVNDSVIVDNTKYLSNSTYNGTSIVDALSQINVDSSFNNRSRLAELNNIQNYTGSAEQNIKMLDLLKRGLLKSN